MKQITSTRTDRKEYKELRWIKLLLALLEKAALEGEEQGINFLIGPSSPRHQIQWMLPQKKHTVSNFPSSAQCSAKFQEAGLLLNIPIAEFSPSEARWNSEMYSQDKGSSCFQKCWLHLKHLQKMSLRFASLQDTAQMPVSALKGTG